jgi:hypothetical protein
MTPEKVTQRRGECAKAEDEEGIFLAFELFIGGACNPDLSRGSDLRVT